MTDADTLAGACHCGEVRVRTPGGAVGVVVCHGGRTRPQLAWWKTPPLATTYEARLSFASSAVAER